MIQLNAGQFMQVDVGACSAFRIHAKSTSASARVVTIKYRKRSEANFTTLTPNISVQAAAVFDLTGLFSALLATDSISVRIEAAGNIQVHDLYVAGTLAASNGASITSFKLPGQIGSEQIFADDDSISITVPMGTNLSAVVPQQVQISPNATILPAVNVARDFSTVVIYSVTAQDGVTVRHWKVNVRLVASTEKNITAFKLSDSQIGLATIDSAAATVRVLMPLGSSLTNLVPVLLEVSPFATVSPLPTAALNFSAPVQYTVTAQNSSSKVWTVTVQIVDPNALFYTYEAEDAEFTGRQDNTHANYSGAGFVDFLADGENQISFTVCQTQAGSQTAKFRYALAKDGLRRGALYVNDVFIQTLAFPRTITFSDWSEEIAVFALPAGISKIKLVWDSTDGPNLDRMMLSGNPCNSFVLSLSSTNNGKVSVSPQRNNNRYFDAETVTISAENLPALAFVNWTGDIAGNANPVSLAMTSNKTVVGQFTVVPTFKLSTTSNGLGEVALSPAGGEYPINTVVTATAKTVSGSSFLGWQGDATGSNPVASITMNATKAITANFSAGTVPNFETVVGFASAAGDGFTGAVTGGQCASDTLVIAGPSAFNLLCESLYNRQRAFKTNATVGGMKKAPLVILLKAGIYDASQPLTSTGANAFGNSMLDIAEQSQLTFLGESAVVFKFGINVKRSWNVLIRNISFYDYQDDGINVGYPETHHVWIDHCTFGHPVALPSNKETPDGGCEIKDGASFVTVSWCKFQNHWKTSLNGHSDNNGSTDAGRLKITYYANYFYNTNSRNPRVRFGQVHVLNNLYENTGLGRSGQLGYGIAASNNAQVVAEANFFVDTRWPMFADRSVADFTAVYGPNLESPTGNRPCFGIKPIGNAYDDAGLTQSLVGKVSAAMLNTGGKSIRFDSLVGPSFNFNPAAAYDYSAALLPASAVRVLIPQFAGADKVTFVRQCGTLPAAIVEFYGVAQGGTHQLYWKVASQHNVSHYLVEQSGDGLNFATIGRVKAAAMFAGSPYQLMGVQPKDGKNWYRIKTVDVDGSAKYSKTIVLMQSGSFSIHLGPNPAGNSVTLTYAALREAVTVSVKNVQGVTMVQQNAPVGSSSLQVDVSALPAGQYWLIFEGLRQRIVKPLSKL
jgi:pectate lyase